MKAMWIEPSGLRIALCVHACLLVIYASAASAETIALSFPLRCELHKNCFIQNHVDIDPTAGAKDYRCGGATYDRHKGTDFRVVSVREAARGVPVIAAAPGRVKAARDGIEDRLVEKNTNSLRGRKCGNEVVIEHGQGWETQYCHLRKGSLRVRPGQQVKRGDPIGSVGYSGLAQFPHLHLTVRQGGRVIDPFTGRTPDGLCATGPQKGLWHPDTGTSILYQRGELIEIGFSDRPVSTRGLEEGQGETARPSAESAAMIFYARFINLETGDTLRLVLRGPSGVLAKNVIKPLKRHKAQYFAYTGRRLRAQRWPSGRYRGHVQLIRSGKVVFEQDATMDLE